MLQGKKATLNYYSYANKWEGEIRFFPLIRKTITIKQSQLFNTTIENSFAAT
jgi:hypothetical protein